MQRLRLLVASWSAQWGVPGLERRLALSFSPRITRSLGRFSSKGPDVRLAAWLLASSPVLREEAACHEAAHAAVLELHGRRVRPHGPQWQALMRSAGFEPRVRIPEDEVPAHLRRTASRRRSASDRILWEHRCPVCQATRLARRRVSGWRCALCRAAGLSGELVVRSRPARRAARG
jgi:predicted SprT family Zn-dependent metalloprotease